MQTLQQLDVSLFLFFNKDIANPFLDAVCPLWRNKFFWIPLYVFLGALFFKKYKWQSLWVVVFAALVVLLADQISASLIKPFFARLRPCNNPELVAQIKLLVRCGSGYSFVSSHAANHFGLAVFLCFLFKQTWVRILLMLWEASIAFSQVYVGVHFPADVCCGALLGIAIGWLVGTIFNSKIGVKLNEV